jgi:exopolyphosphatase/guanosine-5'-triphosphate,3'-diphosphate pyrophosphatase
VKLPAAEADALITKLLAATVAERRAMKGMEPKRADVIAAGAAIFGRVVARAGADALLISDRGIRWGVAYELAGLT